MSMSTHVVGIKPPDKKWKAMKAAYDACVEAEADIPQAVLDFFGDEQPDLAGVIVNVKHRAYESDEQKGIEIDLSEISKDVKIIRFYNSW